MGLFDLFRRAPSKPDPVLTHPVFGEIRLVDDQLWEGGRVQFPPLGVEIEVSINAPESGPDERHVIFVREFVARWSEILGAAEPIARRTLTRWVEAPDRGEIWPRLRLESFNVRAELKPDTEWELIFWCEEASHWLCFVMMGWKPVDAFVDG